MVPFPNIYKLTGTLFKFSSLPEVDLGLLPGLGVHVDPGQPVDWVESRSAQLAHFSVYSVLILVLKEQRMQEVTLFRIHYDDWNQHVSSWFFLSNVFRFPISFIFGQIECFSVKLYWNNGLNYFQGFYDKFT